MVIMVIHDGQIRFDRRSQSQICLRGCPRRSRRDDRPDAKRSTGCPPRPAGAGAPDSVRRFARPSPCRGSLAAGRGDRRFRTGAMRGVLVDTQILLWVRIVPEKLTPAERRVLDSAFFRYVSAATLWEMAILMDLGRIARDERLFELPENFDFLPVHPAHCRTLLTLPRHHRDPFDRMLIAQARCERLPLLTRDAAIAGYGRRKAAVVWFSAR